MRKNNYLLNAEINPGIYLCYNSFSDQFLLMDKIRYDKLESNDYLDLEKEYPDFYAKLMDGDFVVEDDFDELSISLHRKTCMHMDASCYHVMVNTTLDCNLNCWYCYENKIKGSKLTSETISLIGKNIKWEYECSRFNILKVSFFGGEPFMEFEAMKALLDFAEEFCKEKDIKLIADFTTNAVLITEQHISYLKKFECHFQITLDGDREVHNKIKKDHINPSFDTYQKVIDTLSLIDQKILNRLLAVRINFDNRTLEKIDEIISDIEFLDRRFCYVIIKKVWQVPKEKINEDLLYSAIQKFFNKKFLVDYYFMPKGYLCFAERRREVLFNYDGKIFKCSTISSFTDENSLGQIDLTTGGIKWDRQKTALWFKDLLPDDCKQCKWFPACLGPCNKQLLLHKGEHICTFDAMNMGDKEYLMYSFKYHLLKEELQKSCVL